MMKEDAFVEVLHHILNQISDNTLGECCEIIEKLFESIHCNDTLTISKTLFSIKLLLKLYEKINLTSGGMESTLPTEKIFQGIKYLSNKALDIYAQNDLLSIISVLCKISVNCEWLNFTQLLTAYYDHIFSEILAISKLKEYDSERVMLLLKILRTLYRSEFCDEKTKTNLKEGKVEALLLAFLALNGDENIATQTSLFIIPDFVNFFKTNAPVKFIWTEFSQGNSFNYSRIFLILCNFVSVNLLIDEINLMEFLVGQVNYWELLQYGLLNGDISMRKQAMYLFKNTIDVLGEKRKLGEDASRMLECSANCHWDFSRRDELIKIYSDIIIILEYLNEEQVHIVRPIFEKIEKVVKQNIQCNVINFSWILVIYEIMLLHESTEVNKWGIRSLLKVPGKVFSHEAEAIKMAFLLSSNLNNINLYYNNGLDVTEALGAFFKNIAELNTAELFFKTFIKEMCKQVWSPEALFFVTRSFSQLRELSFWGPEEVAEIRVFVSKAFRTHNKTIRNGIRCEILNAVMALTHKSNLPLDSFILLFSKISTPKMLRVGQGTWNDVITYLKNRYSEEDAKRVLDLFLSSTQHNEECAALSIILFHHAFDCVVTETFMGLLSSFRNSHQRPYCEVSKLNQYLLILSYITEKYIQCGDHSSLIAKVFPFLEDMVLYVHLQIRVLSSPKDFSTCKLYLKAFENLMNLIKPIDFEHNLRDLFKRLLECLEKDLCHRQELSSVQMYFGMKLVKIIYESCPYNLNPVCLDRYLLEYLNEPVTKEENSTDMQMIWGKMNSEFFEAKWVILEILIRSGKIRPTEKRIRGTNFICNEDLLKMCIEGLDVGGYGALRPIMVILAGILPQINNIAELESIVDSVWSIILERRKTDDFKICVESFMKMLFQEKLFSRGEILQVLIKYIDLIFSDSSLVVVHTLVAHTENLDLTEDSMPVLCQILGKGLLFGAVQKKDDKLTAQVCSYVQLFWNCQESESIASSKIRARAAVKLLTIRNGKGVSKSMMDVLMRVESEISKRRTRYFGNSFIHRIKTRLIQGMLLLVDSFEDEEKKKIAEWVYLSLVKENPQTSVRNLQEWTLSLLHKSCYSSLEFFGDAIKKTPKGWCSLMTVAYLLAEASLCKIDEAIQEILPFCMDQHFEARLYAEVIIAKLYRLAQRLELKETLQKWRVVHDCIEKSICRAEGNAAKNYAKLEKHFFFNGFNIRSHYSLQTIYFDLPRLANVASDEWIPPEVFDSISVPGAYDSGVNLFNGDDLLQRLSSTEWLVGKPEEFPNGEESEGESLENYQKKMIPVKPLTPGRDSDVTESLEKEGLIVVASLIDRIPNLGGLARTCEVFGASLLVLNTTKCMEDKDFKSVSVTAEKWIRVKEVKVEGLVEYIVEMKEKGFRVMGAEQAVHSEPLAKIKFPRNCLLLLGNEKKGIPPNLIPLLDICVEIPQTGIIRSLNVHVTGALFLWEYAKQNVFTLDQS